MVLLLCSSSWCDYWYIHTWYYWRKRKHNIDRMVESDYTDIDVSYGKMYKEIIAYSIPSVIVSLNYPLFNLVDQFT